MHSARPEPTPRTPPTPPTATADTATLQPIATPCLEDDGTLAAEVDIAFSTHLTLVVPARIEFWCGAAPQDIDLVIARAQCRDRRPRWQALIDAVHSALGRGEAGRLAAGRPSALSARMAGQWQALCAWPVEGQGFVPSRG